MSKDKQGWDTFWQNKSTSLFGKLKQSLSKEFAKFILKNKKNGKLLDAGCGESLSSRFLKNKIYTVGVDYSENACKLAMQNCDEVVNADILNLPFQDSEFDITCNQGVIQTVDRPKELLKEMLRVTKKDGLVIFTVPKKYSMVHLEYKLPKKPVWEVKQKFYSKKELSELLTSMDLDHKIKSFWKGQLYIVTINKKQSLSELQKTMEIMGEMTNYYKHLYKIIKKYFGKRVLDIGCGDGSFIKFMKDKEFIFGTDYDDYPIAKAIENFKGKANVEFSKGDILDENFLERLRKYNFDTVVSINVFEHIENDVSAFKNVNSLLQENGRFVIMVPALQFLYGSIDKAVGHVRRYDKNELIQKLENSGFVVEKVFYLKLIEVFGYYVVGKILKKTLSDHKNSLVLYDKLIPYVWRIENFFNLPFGSSIVAIVRKK